MKTALNCIEINGRSIGSGFPTYIIAEISANHNQDFGQALKLIEAAKKAGADAVKLQTYTPDTMTIDCDEDYFKINGTIWEGKNLYDLYTEAYMPWEWQPELKKNADKMDLHLFSTPFDISAVKFLEDIDVPAYKVASFELVDLPLLREIAKTGKSIIMSTGMASLSEIDEAVRTVSKTDSNLLALLKCTSAYPASPEEMNLLAIPNLAKVFDVPVGLSDHSMDTAITVAAVALGACIIEKHFTLSRRIPGPDSAFSLEPYEFKKMVDAVRITEKALGKVNYDQRGQEVEIREFRRSLFLVQDMKAGQKFTFENVRSIRPGHGLHTRYFEEVIGRHATRDIRRGTPLSWDLIGGHKDGDE